MVKTSITEGSMDIKTHARKLRSQGHSLNQIASVLNLPKSTLSLWIRDVPLTDEQKQFLRNKNPIFNPELRGPGGGKSLKSYYGEIRKKNRKKGQELVKEKIANQDIDFIAGIMLYWAEGYRSNNKNVVKFTNTQAEMVRFFLNFLRKYFNVKNPDIKVSIYYHEGEKTITEIQDYWLNYLSLTHENLNRPYLENKREVSGIRKNRYPYGICNLLVYSTEILQQIYGAIQEYVGFEKPDWNA
jgi:hypothetical protein